MTRPHHRSRARSWLAGFTTLALIVGAGAIPGASVMAAEPEPTNIVLVWNENAINVMGAGTSATPPGLGQGPPLSPLHLAMVQDTVA